MRGQSGAVKKNIGLLAAIAVLIIIFYHISPTLATAFNAAEENQPALIAGTLRTLNISVANLNVTYNISTVVISLPYLPGAYILVNNTNSTSALNTNFTNQTDVLGNWNLTWQNSTPGGFINASGTEYFIFDVYLPPTSGTSIITVYTTANGTVNATNVTLTITGLSNTVANISIYEEGFRFNWTNSTITVESLFNTTQFYIDTLQTNVTSIYFTEFDYLQDEYVSLNGSNRERCFDINNAGYGLEFSAVNTSLGAAGFTNRSLFLNATQVASFTLATDTPYCPPGLYQGTFAVRNVTLPGNAIHISAAVHIPISVSNTFFSANNSATFKGNVSTLIQSYYFNTTITGNITSVTFNSSTSADLFLVDSVGLLDRFVESGTREITRFLPDLAQMWEIRI